MQENIVIIGAGVSGLTAAIELEKAGRSPLIIDANMEVGGRVHTVQEHSHFFDIGFQVLLSAYPAVKEYLDLKDLETVEFLPGALIYHNKQKSAFGDPLRHGSFFGATLFSKHATLGDKLKVYRLSQQLKKTSLEEIFAKPEMSTLSYLQQQGFSAKIIERFFQPFYTGIFLEPNLATSSRMFEFVFKMFAEGKALIPKKGIGAVAKQLKDKLKKSTFLLNTKVKRVEQGSVYLENGEEVKAQKIIVATDPSSLLPTIESTTNSWNSCYNLYFSVDKAPFSDKIIALIPEKDCLINNFHIVSNLQDVGKDTVISITVVGAKEYSEQELINRVSKDLEVHTGIRLKQHLKTFTINRALPQLSNLAYRASPTKMHHSEGIYLSGDYLANPSLNAAMLSGHDVVKLLLTEGK